MMFCIFWNLMLIFRSDSWWKTIDITVWTALTCKLKYRWTLNDGIFRLLTGLILHIINDALHRFSIDSRLTHVATWCQLHEKTKFGVIHSRNLFTILQASENHVRMWICSATGDYVIHIVRLSEGNKCNLWIFGEKQDKKYILSTFSVASLLHLHDIL